MINQIINNEITEKFNSSHGFLVQETLQLQANIEIIEDNNRQLDLKLIQLRSNKIFNLNISTDSQKDLTKTFSVDQNGLTEEKNVIDQINSNYKELNDLIQRKEQMNSIIKCIELGQSALSVDSKEQKDHGNYGIKLLETQESERKRIARELHDTTVQNITNLMHKSELCFKLIDRDPIRAKLELETMSKTIKTTIKDMRNIIYDLRPMLLDDLGLVPTVERFTREFSKAQDIEVELEVKNKEITVLSVINVTLFRIIQEAANNAVKHGKASKIFISINYTGKGLKIFIQDNGMGLDYSKMVKKSTDIYSGYGLSMMKERVHLLSGEIEFKSSTDEGTQIEVWVPLRTYKEDI